VKKVTKLIILEEGFSLLELLITLAIFGILMVTTTSILVINLTVARKVKARSYAREETAFMFNVLKKDIRNAEEALTINPDNIEVKVVDENSQTHTYTWRMDNDIVQRAEVSEVSYKTPSDIKFYDLSFEGSCEEENCIVKISAKAWTNGMPGSMEDTCDSKDKQCIQKEVVVSTRNFE